MDFRAKITFLVYNLKDGIKINQRSREWASIFNEAIIERNHRTQNKYSSDNPDRLKFIPRFPQDLLSSLIPTYFEDTPHSNRGKNLSHPCHPSRKISIPTRIVLRDEGGCVLLDPRKLNRKKKKGTRRKKKNPTDIRVLSINGSLSQSWRL